MAGENVAFYAVFDCTLKLNYKINEKSAAPVGFAVEISLSRYEGGNLASCLFHSDTPRVVV